LAELGHVVSVDMKGSGAAPKPDDGRYSPSDQAALVHRLIESLDLTNITLVGHSLGGGVTLLTALRLLDAESTRLKRFVIVGGAAYPQSMPPFIGLAERPRLSAFLFRLLGSHRIVRTVLRSIVHDKRGVDEAQVRGYSEPLRSPVAVRALIDSARQIVPPDLASIVGRYGEISTPGLLLWGRNDRVVPLSVGERLAAALPNARLHVLDDCGHLPAEELPDESFAILADFLGVPGSRQRIST
jgi:pimeloyl-ACP methyl ester carboxylesterase